MHALPGAYRGLRRFLSAQEGQVGDVLDPGQVVAHYDVEDVVGSGGTGIVYRAHDVRLGRRVALKVLSPHLAGDPATRERIGLETVVVAALAHPNVLPLFGIAPEEAEGVLYPVRLRPDGPDRHEAPPAAVALDGNAQLRLARAHPR